MALIITCNILDEEISEESESSESEEDIFDEEEDPSGDIPWVGETRREEDEQEELNEEDDNDDPFPDTASLRYELR